MSGRYSAYKQPVGQKRLTNIAVVRYKKHGHRFEIACYKNKVISWRNKVEKDLDEVLQSRTVYQNVSKGVLANSKDLIQSFGTDDHDKISLEILEHGELQVSDKERELAYSSQWRDIATIVMDKTVNPETERPYPIGMIERFMREMHFAVDPHHSSKQQALELIPKLQKKFPISRAQMKLRLTVPTSCAPEIRETLVGGWGSRIEKEEHGTSGHVSLIFQVDPGRFRECDALSKDNKGRLEVVSMSVQKEGDASVDIYDEDQGERAFSRSAALGPSLAANDAANCVLVDKFSEAMVIGGKAWDGDRGKGGRPSETLEAGDGAVSSGQDLHGSNGAAKGGAPAGATAGRPLSAGGKVQKCNTCNAEFEGPKEHREHFKSDWHKHNLKRKMKGLPPLSAEECDADTQIEDAVNDMHQYSR